MKWLRRKSAEHQLRNTIFRVRKVVAATDVLTAAWEAGGQPTPEAVSAFQTQKNRLVTDMVGGVGVEQLRRTVIEPELLAIKADKNARSAVISVCDWMIKQGTDQTAVTVFSDDEISEILTRSRQGWVARFLEVED